MNININLENYRTILLKDREDGEVYIALLLNNKTSVIEFQQAINKAIDKHRDEINEYGDDWYFISQELDNFDYIELGNEANIYY